MNSCVFFINIVLIMDYLLGVTLINFYWGISDIILISSIKMIQYLYILWNDHHKKAS